MSGLSLHSHKAFDAETLRCLGCGLSYVYLFRTSKWQGGIVVPVCAQADNLAILKKQT